MPLAIVRRSASPISSGVQELDRTRPWIGANRFAGWSPIKDAKRAAHSAPIDELLVTCIILHQH